MPAKRALNAAAGHPAPCASTRRSNSSRASASGGRSSSSGSASAPPGICSGTSRTATSTPRTVTPLVKAEIGQEVACIGRVVAKGVLPTRRGLRIFHAVLRDDSGVLECVWPGQAFLDRTIARRADPARLGPGAVLPRPPARTPGVHHPRRSRLGGAATARWPPGKVLPVYPGHRRAQPQGHPLAHRPAPRPAHRALRRRAAGVGAPRRPSCRRSPTRCGQCIGPATTEEAERGRRRLAFDELLDLQLDARSARAPSPSGSGAASPSSSSASSPPGCGSTSRGRSPATSSRRSARSSAT